MYKPRAKKTQGQKEIPWNKLQGKQLSQQNTTTKQKKKLQNHPWTTKSKKTKNESLKTHQPHGKEGRYKPNKKQPTKKKIKAMRIPISKTKAKRSKHQPRVVKIPEQLDKTLTPWIERETGNKKTLTNISLTSKNQSKALHPLKLKNRALPNCQENNRIEPPSNTALQR